MQRITMCTIKPEHANDSESTKKLIILYVVFCFYATAAYQKLIIAKLDYRPEEFLFYLLVMANKYDYGPAYLDVFYSLKDSFDSSGDDYSLSKMDEKQKPWH